MFSNASSSVVRLFSASSRTHLQPSGMKALRLAGVVTLALIMLAAAPLVAQTAHYGAVVNLGSGFSSPTGVTVDGSGNVYVADFGNSQVKVILAVNGTIPASPTVVTLGSGFSDPFTVAVDGNGNVFVTDYGNHAVKEIEAVNGSIPSSPVIRSLGSGYGTLFGTALDGKGDLFVTDYSVGKVKELVAVDGVIPAEPKILSLGGGFNIPAGLAIDGNGNVFVGDQNNSAVKEILAASGYTSTITVASGFITPDGVAVDANGNVYVANNGGDTVQEIVAVNGVIPASPTILTLGGEFNQPFDVAVDKNGNVYVAEKGNNAVKEIVNAGLNFGPAIVGTFAPFPLTLYFTFDTGGTLGSTAVLTQGDPGLDFNDAGGDTCTAGISYIAGQVCAVNVNFRPTAPGPRYGAVELLSQSGALLATGYVQGTGVGPQITFANTTSGVYLPNSWSDLGIGGLNQPDAAAVDASSNVFIADSGNNAVKELVAAGGWTTVKTLGGGFSSPNGVAVDGSGNVFVADTFNQAVKEIVAAGGYTTVNTLGSGFDAPYAVAVDGSGNVFVADFATNTVKEILAFNGRVPASPTIRTLAGGLSGPDGVAVDGNGNVFVANYIDSTVEEIEAVNGSIPASPTIRTIGSGFSGPSNLSVDGAGNVFVADTINGLVKEIVAAGGYTTVNTVGSGFFSPEAATVDKYGNVFVADAANNTVQRLDFADPPSLFFATTPVGSTSHDSPQTVTVSNDGNAALIFPVPGAGANPAISPGFTLGNGTTCPELHASGSAAGTLAAGTSCSYAVDFTPVALGEDSGALLLTDNNLNATGSTQSIGLAGTGIAAPAVLTSPTPGVGTILGTTSVIFQWTAGSGATEYELWLGTTKGGSDLFTSGGVKTTQATVTSLPSHGVTVYARLLSYIGATWQFNDYTYTESGTLALATLTTPAPGLTTILGTTNVVFGWTAGNGPTEYMLYLGTTLGGSNLYHSGGIKVTQVTVPSLPSNGSKVFARLFSYINAVWQSIDYVYTESQPPAPAALISPTPGLTTILGTTNVVLKWTAGHGPTGYQLYLGTTLGGKDLFNSGTVKGTQVTVPTLPSHGAKVYARLFSYLDGAWVSKDYIYQETN
jgi:streptogramin lyase